MGKDERVLMSGIGGGWLCSNISYENIKELIKILFKRKQNMKPHIDIISQKAVAQVEV